MNKRKVIIIGKLPPPYMGPSIAFNILIHSRLNDFFELTWFNVQINRSLNAMGKWTAAKFVENFKLYFQFSKRIREDRPELALIPISQSTPGFIKDSIFILLCILHKTPVIIQLRGSNFQNWIQNSSLITKAFVKYVLKKTTGVIVLGEQLRYLFAAYFPPEKIYVIPNGADIIIPAKQKQTAASPNILYLGNLQGSKGIEDVIKAVDILNKKHPGNFSVTVAGGWREDQVKKNCLNITEMNQLPVTFTGPVSGDKKYNLLANADIFVFTPRDPEGHPWAIVEAMAAGLPVVTTNRGAITESISNGINGFVVEVRNPAAIASKLELLISDHALRETMGSRNKSDYLEKYTESKMIARYRDVFNSILESPHHV